METTFLPDKHDLSFMHSLLSCANEQEQRRLRLIMEAMAPTVHLAPLDEWTKQYLERYFSSAPSRMHEWLLRRFPQFVAQSGQRLAIVAPRGGAKTTWISKAFPLYCAVHRLEPYVLLISNTIEQSEKNLSAIKDELERNSKLAASYPHACGPGSVWSTTRIETRNGVCIEAVGHGSKIRGRTFGPHRPTLIVVDDLENDESVQSPEQREKTLSWFNRAVLSVGTKGTNVFVLGTALHRDDMLQRLKTVAGWECRTFPSIIREPANQHLWRDWQSMYADVNNPHRETEAREFYEQHQAEMDEGAIVLWPDREPLYDLMCLRATIGESAFQAEKQGNPTSPRTSEWPDTCFDKDIWFDRWPELRLRVISLDPSKGGSETGDYSAYVMVGIGHDGLIYVDADLARRDTTQMIEDGLAIAEWFPPDAFAVEVNQFQELLQKELADASRRRGMMLPIYGITNTVNKRTRIRKLTPYVRNKQLRFRTNSPGAALLVEQLREFPTGRHDDGPDSLEMALKTAQFLLSNDSTHDPNNPLEFASP